MFEEDKRDKRDKLLNTYMEYLVRNMLNANKIINFIFTHENNYFERK